MDSNRKAINHFSLSSPEVITKKMLCLAMGYNPRTFSKRLKALESELKEISPRYNKNCSILTHKEALFIVEENGTTLAEIRKRYWEIVNPNKLQNQESDL